MRRLRLLLSLLALASLPIGFLPGALDAQGPALPDKPVVARLYVRDRDHLDAVAGELDIWEVHLEDHYAVAALTPAQYQWLEGLGYRVEVDGEKTALLAPTAILDPRFYYYDDDFANSNGLYVVDFLQAISASYPGITELIDIGDAWMAGQTGQHHRDILVLRISNEDPAFGPVQDKPAFYLFANIHAREVTTPEMVIRYIKLLTSGYQGEGGYGLDADITWLVDHNVLYALVMQNPDGHWKNEQDTGNYWRKNMDWDNGCASPDFWGVDLNRNHSFLWGCCGGSSTNPCSETYRGPSAASEPETQAFQDHFAAVMRDQNGPNGNNEIPPAAPITTTGIFLSLHSYSDLVLWPWGFSTDPAPNDAQLRTIGRKFAYFTGYNPSGDIYTVDGATDDWTYGKFGLASFTFEIGPSGSSANCGSFFPAYECMEGEPGYPRNFWAENKPAFIYAHKIARTPYMTVYGPDAENLSANPNPVQQGTPATLTAHLQDHRYGADPKATIGAAEYFVDRPGEDGTGMAMTPQDGAWGGISETALAIVDSCLSPGRHYLLVHGKKASLPNDYWGPFSAVFLEVEGSCPSPVVIRDVSTAQAGCTFTFTADLTGTAPFTYDWDFGPYGTSAEPTATVTLDSGGVHPYTLTATNCGGVCPDVFAGAVTVDLVHGAAFTWTPPVPQPGQEVTFIGTVSGAEPVSFTWDFGDGQAGTGPTAYHTYTATGEYLVTMTATRDCDREVVAHTVQVCVPVHGVDFAWTPITPTAGLPITFTAWANGTGEITYNWRFGDRSSATGSTVTHVYKTAGTYSVTVTATNCQTASDAMTHALTVEPSPCEPVHDAQFQYAPWAPWVHNPVVFTAAASGTQPFSYSWSFGDQHTGQGMPITHTYSLPGTYTVWLTVTNCSGTALDAVVEAIQVSAFQVYLPLAIRSP